MKMTSISLSIFNSINSENTTMLQSVMPQSPHTEQYSKNTYIVWLVMITMSDVFKVTMNVVSTSTTVQPTNEHSSEEYKCQQFLQLYIQQCIYMNWSHSTGQIFVSSFWSSSTNMWSTWFSVDWFGNVYVVY